MNVKLVRLVAIACLAGLMLAHAPEVWGQGTAQFQVSVASAYLRDWPAPDAPPTYSVFQGQTYPVLGRSADSTWVRLNFAGANRGTWIRAAYGEISGSLASLPVEAPGAGAAVATAPPAAIPAPAGQPVTGDIGSQKLTITVNSTYVRDAPDWSATRVASLFKNQVVTAVARDFTSQWIQVLVNGPGWVPAGAGALNGGLADLPIVDDVAPSVPPPAMVATPSEPLPAWIPVITDRMRAIYQQAGLHGRSQRMFAIAGDCNSESYLYLELVAKGLIDLQGNDYLWPTILQFKNAFYRQSLAVNGGFNSASVMDPLWADPKQCRRGESPFACELRVSRASIVFILLGTGDQYQWQSFEGNYRRMVEHALQVGVLPVLVTKADALETQEGGAEPEYINNIIRSLAQEYEVPLLDFHAATSSLPNHGLMEEPGNDFHLSGEGIGVHVIATLQTLYAIWQPR